MEIKSVTVPGVGIYETLFDAYDAIDAQPKRPEWIIVTLTNGKQKKLSVMRG